jgi:hypothetical protein
MNGNREIGVGPEVDASEDSELLGMIGVVGGNTDFASSDNAWPAMLGGRLNYSHVAVDVENRRVDRRQRAEFVGRLAGINVNGASLAVGRYSGQ